MRLPVLRLVCLISAAAGAALAQPSPVAKTFEEFAARIQLFETAEFAFDRSLVHPLCGKPCEPAVEFQNYLRVTRPAPARVRPLLKHADPKVRTLAIAALFDREDPQYLPAIHALAGDAAGTFASPPRCCHLQPGEPVSSAKSQTVGEVARQLSGPYSPAFWWQHRKRGYSAAWFRFKLMRAGQGTTPTPADRIAKIRAVRKQIDGVPMPDRAWILLFLNGDSRSNALVEEQELVGQLKAVGRDGLLRLLRKERISPDLALRSQANGNYAYHAMCLFVLRHAGQLLLAGDAPFLLGREQWERRYAEHHISDPLISAWWALAAAQVRPSMADRVISAALTRFKEPYEEDDRVQLALALWKHAGPRRLPALVEWFYDDANFSGGYDGRARFLDSLTAAAASVPRDLALWKQLVKDPRFGTLGKGPLEALVRMANAHRLLKPPVAEEDFHAPANHLAQWRERLSSAAIALR